MPEETKGPEAVSPSPEGVAVPASKSTPAKAEAAVANPETNNSTPSRPAEPIVSAPAASATDAKPAAPASAKPVAAKPPAPAKPTGPQPEPWNSELVTKLKRQYGSGIREANTYVGQKYLLVDASIVFEVLSRMRND